MLPLIFSNTYAQNTGISPKNNKRGRKNKLMPKKEKAIEDLEKSVKKGKEL